MNSLDFLWVQMNLNKFKNNISWQRDEIAILFEVYSRVAGKTHKPTGCSRCVANAKNAVYAAYLQQCKKSFDNWEDQESDTQPL